MRASIVEHKVAENAQRTDGLLEAIGELGERMDRRFDAVDRRFEGLEARFDRRLQWLTGTLVATMLAVVSVLFAALLEN